MIPTQMAVSMVEQQTRLTNSECALLAALRTGRWWHREAVKMLSRGDTENHRRMMISVEQCHRAVEYWAEQCLIPHRKWTLKVLGVRLTREQHAMIRNCRRSIPGLCDWDNRFLRHPPVALDLIGR